MSLLEDSNAHEKGMYTQFQKDMAYKIQRDSEQYMFNLIRKAHELTNLKQTFVLLVDLV